MLNAQTRAGVVWPLLFVCTPNQDRTKNRRYHVIEPTLRSIPQLCISPIQLADCHRFISKRLTRRDARNSPSIARFR